MGIILKRDIETILWKYIQKNFLPYNSDVKYDDDENLFNAGIIDSAGLVAFIVFIEKEFNLLIPDEELLPENFNSIKTIANYLCQRCI